MSAYNTKDVERAIIKLFTDQNRQDVQNVLNQYGREAREKEMCRVHLGMLKLSQGNLEKLKHYLDVAKKDYRDVLMWAEYDQNNNLLLNPYKSLISNN